MGLQRIDIEHYFIAEKSQALVFITVGVLAILGSSVWLYFAKSRWHMGFAIAMLVLALVQMTVGWTVHRKADKQRTDAVYSYDLDPSFLRMQELPRMKKVMKNFQRLKWIEWSIFFGGIACLFLFRKHLVTLGYGLLSGLTVQAALGLILDYFAEKRGQEYLNGLSTWLGIS